MRFGHEQLDACRLAVEYVAWTCRLAKGLKGADRQAGDQLLRASQSIPLNIAEGNGKGTNADRRRFFETVCGSALECAAIQDCLEVCEALASVESKDGKAILSRVLARRQNVHLMGADDPVGCRCQRGNSRTVVVIVIGFPTVCTRRRESTTITTTAEAETANNRMHPPSYLGG